MKSVCVIGLGYIGLPTSAVLAARGHRVYGVDVNPEVVRTINEGRIHIVEPELDEFVRSAVGSGRLTAHASPVPADVFVIAVPTPFTEGHRPDIGYVEAATRSLAPNLVPGNLVILESTSPIGTTERVAELLAEMRPDLDVPNGPGKDCQVAVAYCPERVLPGRVIRELVENDRIIGGTTAACTEAALAFYRSFVTGQCLATSARTAEMCKLTENAFRDVNIAFANELSLICDRLDINVWELIGLANHHPRVNILQPGCGVGGHCIAVDPWFIVSQAPEEARLIRTAREVNDGKPGFVIGKIESGIASLLASSPQRRREDLRIACFGLSFKPDIDDLRESPALAIARHVASTHPGPTLIVEPHIESLPPMLANCKLVDVEEAITLADIVVLLVDHSDFKRIPRERFEHNYLVDTRGVFAQRSASKLQAALA